MKQHVAVWLVVMSISGCASAPAEQAQATSAAMEKEPEPEAPRFVILSRLRPLHLDASAESPSIVFRTPDEQKAQFDAMKREREKIADRVAKRAERDAEREEKRAKRVKKRIRRLRGERREAYVEKEAERAARLEREKAIEELEREVDWARDHRGEAPHEHLFAAQLVEERGDWIGVKPVPNGTPACYQGAAPRLAGLDVTLWVKRSHALEVVTRRTRVPVAQGTEVILAPGIAIDRGRAYVDGFELGLNVPDDSKGLSYEIGRGFEAPYTETVFSPIAFSDDLLRLEKDAPLPFNPWYPLHVTATLYVGERFYATTQTPCAEYTLRTIEEALEPVGERGAMRMGGSDDKEPAPPFFRAGAQLLSPSGDPIGTARTDLPVVDEWDGPAGTRCWHYEIWSGGEGRRRIPICTKPDDFQPLKLTDGL